jgi:hypothetical protein
MYQLLEVSRILSMLLRSGECLFSFCATASLTLFLSAYYAFSILFRAADTSLLRHSASAFTLFLKSQRKWTSPALQDTSIELFMKRMKDLDYDPEHVLPHGSYLINPDRHVFGHGPRLLLSLATLAPPTFIHTLGMTEEGEIVRVFPG